MHSCRPCSCMMQPAMTDAGIFCWPGHMYTCHPVQRPAAHSCGCCCILQPTLTTALCRTLLCTKHHEMRLPCNTISYLPAGGVLVLTIAIKKQAAGQGACNNVVQHMRGASKASKLVQQTTFSACAQRCAILPVTNTAHVPCRSAKSRALEQNEPILYRDEDHGLNFMSNVSQVIRIVTANRAMKPCLCVDRSHDVNLLCSSAGNSWCMVAYQAGSSHHDAAPHHRKWCQQPVHKGCVMKSCSRHILECSAAV